MDVADGTYGIDELAEAAGVTRRTVRFYVQRGLLPAPRGLGRGRHYGEEHLRVLQRIKALQEDGVSLALIARQLGAAAEVAEGESAVARRAGPGREGQPGNQRRGGSAATTTATATATAWTHLDLADGVVLQLRDGAMGGATARALIAAVQRAVGLALGSAPGQPRGTTLDDSAAAQEEQG